VGLLILPCVRSVPLVYDLPTTLANSITGTIGTRFIDVIYVMETIKTELIAQGDPKSLLKLWSSFSSPFIYSDYEQLLPEYRRRMRKELKEFIDRLDDDAKEINHKVGALPKDIQYFYLSLRSTYSYFRYEWIYGLLKLIKVKIRNLLFPSIIRNYFIVKLRKYSSRLSSDTMQKQKITINECNLEINELSKKYIS